MDEQVPQTASEHPATWKHAFPVYHPGSRDAVRGWLQANHDHARGGVVRIVARL